MHGREVFFMTGPIIWMTAVLIWYVFGIFNVFWGNVRTHMTMMCVGIGGDVLLTLYLEIGRGVIEKLFGLHAQPFLGNRVLLYAVHVPVAVLLLICYPLVIRSGYKLWHCTGMDFRERKRRHMALGMVTTGLYLASYLSAPGFIIERALASWF